MEYYLQKAEDGSVFGPTDLEVLQYWASEGRIAPGDGISTDRANWTPAVDHADLHMEWLIELDEGGVYGPIHIMALRHMLRDREIATDAIVVHRISGEKHEAGAALLHLLIAHNDRLQQDLETLHAENTELTARKEPAAPAEDLPAEWKEIAQQRDQQEKEAKKYLELYEEQRGRAETLQQRCDEFEEAARRHEVDSSTKMQRQGRELNQLRQQLEAIEKAGQSGGSEHHALIASYNELSAEYDLITGQLHKKAEEVQQAHKARARAEKEAAERIRTMEEKVAREQAEADEARRQAAELEQNHLQLVKNYREMNDRYIRLRQNLPAQQQPAPMPAPTAPKPAPVETPAPAAEKKKEAPAETPQPEAPTAPQAGPSKKGHKPRVRLN